MKKVLWIFLFVVLCPPSFAKAEKLDLMRRWVVFPFEADETLKVAADNAWWKSRERLTAKKKYLVASRQFLMQKDVLQPRRELKPEDVKLLANLLDANVLVTGYAEQRQFTMNVYLAQNGALFWSKQLGFHPSLKASDQLELITEKLTQELLAIIPYQAFTIVDPLIGKAVYEEVGKKYAVIDVGVTDGLTVGMDVQWTAVNMPEDFDKRRPVLSDSKMILLGEGKITKIKRGIVIAELQRAISNDTITEKTMVRFPQEIEKIQSYLSIEASKERIAPEILPTLINPVSPESNNAKKNSLIFGTILSILGILALAF
ncbi:MAG: hypothetical protein SGI74_01130 [Oligoflexia bacterium]|nr:hypothetical protein [Oligoflexia bacterium]